MPHTVTGQAARKEPLRLLREAWETLTRSLGVPRERGDAVFHLLEQCYGEAHRAYHTLTHVAQVLDTVEALIAAGEPVTDQSALRLAAWFHDVVYDPRRNDNEARSAELADRVLADWSTGAARRRRVRALILATADHAPSSPNERVLVDADLAILAAAPGDYRAYTRAIRKEYGWLQDEDFRAGRSAFLAGLLAREHLFATATMRSRREHHARRNLKAELDGLQRADA